MLTLEKLKEVLHYDSETGIFTWLVKRGSLKPGNIAGSINPFGYRRIKIFGKLIMAHVLAWFYMTGEWPEIDIDHKNRNRDDNRWENLRKASRTKNTYNSLKRKNNTSGYKGVYFHKVMGKYRAKIVIEGKTIILGFRETAEEASKLYEEASLKYHEEFSIFNKSEKDD